MMPDTITFMIVFFFALLGFACTIFHVSGFIINFGTHYDFLKELNKYKILNMEVKLTSQDWQLKKIFERLEKLEDKK